MAGGRGLRCNFKHLAREKPRDNLRGWALRVAHNLGLKRRAAASRRMEVSIHSGETGMDTQADSALNPEEQAVAAQQRKRLLSIVPRLARAGPLVSRAPRRGLRYREIAQILGISLGSVSASLARSLGRLVFGAKG